MTDLAEQPTAKVPRAKYRHGRGNMIIDIGWHPGTGTWDPNSPVGQAIGLMANGRSRQSARSAANISPSGMAQWIDRGRGALESAELDPEVAYADQRDEVPWHVRVYADFVVQADIAECAAVRQVEARWWRNVLASEKPADQLEVLRRRLPNDYGEVPVKAEVDVNVTLHPAASLLGDPVTRAASIALAEAMAIAASQRADAIEATSTEL